MKGKVLILLRNSISLLNQQLGQNQSASSKLWKDGKD